MKNVQITEDMDSGGSAQGITEVSGIFIRLGEQEVQYEQENYNN